MLEQKDLEAIRGIVVEAVGESLEQIVLPRFDALETRMDRVEGRLDGIDVRLDGIDGQMSGVNGRLDRIESTMVTKDFLEDRLADFKSELKNTGGKALVQIKRLATELHRNGGLSKEQVVQVTAA